MRQPPDPLQVPSVPHDAGPRSLQLFFGSAPPAGTAVQVPAVPVRLHEKQPAVQAEEQQTPCAQKFDTHSPACEQSAPIGFNPHEPPLQMFGETHWSEAPHELAHRVPSHLKGAQLSADGVEQAPVLHSAGWRYRLVVLSQLSGRHSVPDGYF